MRSYLVVPSLQSCWLVLAFWWPSPIAVQASPRNQLLTEFWYPDGPVNAILEANGTIYLGGQFHYVGPATGQAAELDVTTGERNPDFPLIDGSVHVAVPDGAGGWFLGGIVNEAGGLQRGGLAHVLSDRTVDPNWDPVFFGEVRALALAGNSLYVGGQFLIVDGVERQGLAALDATTGELLSWNPALSAPNFPSVNSLVVAGGSVYAGGTFRQVGTAARTNLAAIDAATGSATSWNPSAPGASVNALQLSGDMLYVGGSFTNIGGLNRTNIAAVNLTTGSASAWAADNANGGVQCLAMSGSTLYVGGIFTRIGGAATRLGLAALDISTGTATAWNPESQSAVGSTDPFSVGGVRALAVAGGAVYVGGHFKQMGGQVRYFAAAVDAVSGSPLPWHPGADFDVRTIAVSGSTILAGGDFSSIGGVMRSGLAALDSATGEVRAWNSDIDYYGYVNALAVADNKLFIGGSFTNVAGQSRRGIAAVDEAGGALDAWNPNPAAAAVTVNALGVAANSLFVGGAFQALGGQNRTNLAALDTTTASASTWNPSVPASGIVHALALGDGVVYVGGTFTTLAGQTRRRVGALDLVTAAPTSWNPDANNTVYALTVANGIVYAGGSFLTIDGLSRTNVAALNSSDGAALPGWDASSLDALNLGHFEIRAIAAQDEAIYIGGFLSQDPDAFELEPSTGLAHGWAPEQRILPFYTGSAGYQSGVRAILPSSDRVYLGGAFPGSFSVHSIVVVTAPTFTAPEWVGGLFRFRLLGTDGQGYQIESSGEFSDWYPLDVVFPAGGFYDYEDPTSSSFENRAYRAYSVSTP